MRSNILGVGCGLRSIHLETILKNLPAIPWFELLADNYMVSGGAILDNLYQVRSHYPVTLHCVGMSIGGSDPINIDYLKKVKSLKDSLDTKWISDHLSFSSHQGLYFPDLYPLPQTRDVIQHVVQRIKVIQDILEERIMIENVSSYFSLTNNEMPEWTFLQAISEQADCDILLDINNIYINAQNHHFEPRDYIGQIAPERVKQYHLGGFEDKASYLLDSHSCAVHQEVWHLYQHALEIIGCRPTCIEWDNDIPPFEVLENEVKKATKLVQEREYVAA